MMWDEREKLLEEKLKTEKARSDKLINENESLRKQIAILETEKGILQRTLEIYSLDLAKERMKK